MKLSELQAILDKVRASCPDHDVDVVFCDYSQRAFPILDLDSGFTSANFAVKDHVHTSGPLKGAVSIPLGRTP